MNLWAHAGITCLGLALGFVCAQAFAQDPGLVVWYKMDETSGTVVADSSGNGNDGTVIGAEGWTAGRIDGGFDCAGAGYIRILGDSLDSTVFATVYSGGEISVAVWLYGGDTQPVDDWVFSSRSNDSGGGKVAWTSVVGKMPNASGEVEWSTGCFGETQTTSSAVDASTYKGSWHHWVFTKNVNTGDMKIYLDGAEFASETGQTNAFYDNWHRFYIGKDHYEDPIYDGILDDFRLYDRELTASEIAELAQIKVSVTATDPDAAEEALDPGSFTVARSAAWDEALTVTVDVATGAGQATGGGVDYDETIGTTVVILANELSTVLTVTPVDDAVDEGDETVTVAVQAGAGYAVDAAAASATVTILDNDAATVWIEATDPDALEDPSTPETGTFVVHRSGGPAGDVTVDISITGTADHTGLDYTLAPAVTTSVTVPEGGSTTVTLTPEDDDISESDDTVTITLTGGTDVVVDAARQEATVTIVDDDGWVVTIETSTPTVNEDEGLTAPGVFTVRRGGSTAGDLEVELTISGTAASGTDYGAITSPVTILDGDSTATIEVKPVDDSVQAPDRTVVVTVVTGAADYVPGTPDEATVTILEDDIYIEWFSLVGPGDGTNVEVDADTEFTWNEAVGATDYEVLISKSDTDFAGAVKLSSSTTTATLREGLLDYETPYYWKVVAESKQATVESDGVFTFTTLSDSKHPTVSNTKPADGASRADVSTTVNVQFSEAMTRGTVVDAASIRDASGVLVPGDWVLEPGEVVLTFRPRDRLAYEATYTVTIKDDTPTDTADNALDVSNDPSGVGTSYVFSFTTWRPLAGLATGDGCAVAYPRPERPAPGRVLVCLLLGLGAVLAVRKGNLS